MPQQAVQRGSTGDSVMVVDADGKVTPRPVKVGTAQGGNWVILDGVKTGEMVMVDGFQKLRGAAPVKPVPWQPGRRREQRRRRRAAAGRAPRRRRAEPAMAQFFIDRPIFAWVIALFILVMGGVSIKQLPIAQYPSVAPPSIVVTAVYPGASAQTLEDSVISVIEQEMNGSPGLIYLESTSQANGVGRSR